MLWAVKQLGGDKSTPEQVIASCKLRNSAKQHQGGILKHLEVSLSSLLQWDGCRLVSHCSGQCLCPSGSVPISAVPAQTHPQLPGPSRPIHFPVCLCSYLSV